mmetsp:Transcript_2656/g.4239  ORF Transcript_2656/g.4239 Transcript_2656/m.4239 type:complete len:177 (-) Transcript_2656:1045-1575(-)
MENTRKVSIQHILRVSDQLKPVNADLRDPRNYSANDAWGAQFEYGKFVAFLRPRAGRKWLREIHIAEVYEPYCADGNWISLHSYVDLGANDEAHCNDLTKPLATRRLRPEYRTLGGPSFTSKLKRTSCSGPVILDLKPEDMEILATGFDLTYDGRIPAKVVAEIREAHDAFLKRRT